MSVYPPPLNNPETFSSSDYLYTEELLTVGQGIELFRNTLSNGGLPGSFTNLAVSGTLTLNGNTANRLLTLNSSKIVTSSTATDTEAGYLSGVTSSIQIQLNTLNTNSLSNKNRWNINQLFATATYYPICSFDVLSAGTNIGFTLEGYFGTYPKQTSFNLMFNIRNSIDVMGSVYTNDITTVSNVLQFWTKDGLTYLFLYTNVNYFITDFIFDYGSIVNNTLIPFTPFSSSSTDLVSDGYTLSSNTIISSVTNIYDENTDIFTLNKNTSISGSLSTSGGVACTTLTTTGTANINTSGTDVTYIGNNTGNNEISGSTRCKSDNSYMAVDTQATPRLALIKKFGVAYPQMCIDNGGSSKFEWAKLNTTITPSNISSGTTSSLMTLDNAGALTTLGGITCTGLVLPSGGINISGGGTLTCDSITVKSILMAPGLGYPITNAFLTSNGIDNYGNLTSRNGSINLNATGTNNTNIGNSTGITTITNLNASNSTVTINTTGGNTTSIGTGGAGQVQIGNTGGGTIITGSVGISPNGELSIAKNTVVSVSTSATTVITLTSSLSCSNLITIFNDTDQNSNLYLVTTGGAGIVTITQIDSLGTTTFIASSSGYDFKLQTVSGSKNVYTSYIRI